MSNKKTNRFDYTGKLTRIDTFTTGNGKRILSLIFAEEDGKYPATIPIKVFGRLADMASDWHPGDVLEVTGTLSGRDWNDKVYPDIVAESVEVVSEAQTELPSGGAVPSGEVEDPGSTPF